MKTGRLLIGLFALALVLLPKQSFASSYQPRLYSEFQIPKLSDLEQQWKKRIWLSKTASKLWKGYQLKEGALLDRWMAADEQAVVLEMLADTRFIKTAIDFSYYYLGRKSTDKAFEWGNDFDMNRIGQFPQVIQLAKQLEENQGDFFEFYSSMVPAYIFKLRDPPDWIDSIGHEEGDEAPPVLNPKQRREKIHQNLLAEFEKLKQVISGDDFDKNSFCMAFNSNQAFFTWVQAYGYEFNTVLFHPGISFPFFSIEFEYCGQGKSYSKTELIGFLNSVTDFLSVIHEQTKAGYEADQYSPTNFSEMKPGPSPLFVEGKIQPFRLSYDAYLNNNSTNFNRRRAAYFLDRFFCDDLTPVAIEDGGGDHTDDRHGTQASCMACHYRLDPMAGFFKTRGFRFIDFADQPTIFFDDAATMNTQEYLNTWRAPAGSGREWNIGYIRSEKNEAENRYGDSLEDLSAIMKSEYEVRSCLVKRVFQYMTSSDQTMDGDFIDYITEQFNEQAEDNSLAAFQDLFGKAVLSKTYSEENRAPNECYDFRPGLDPRFRPPCQVASILEKTCYKCHSFPGGKGGLHLDTWLEIAPGQFSFEHFSKEGEQIPKAQTMAKIAERLSSPDPEKRMPSGGGHMGAIERKDLYLWALDHSEQEEVGN